MGPIKYFVARNSARRTATEKTQIKLRLLSVPEENEVTTYRGEFCVKANKNHNCHFYSNLAVSLFALGGDGIR